MAESSQHILLSSMGINQPRKTNYAFEGKEASSGFAAFGLWQLLPEKSRPNEIWFLLTPEAKEAAWGEIRKEAELHGLKVHSVCLSAGSGSDEPREFLEIAAKEIPQGCRLTLDITQGLRHHAFLFYALALYLSRFRGIRIEGAWYCRLETADRDAPKPLIDLKPVLDLAYWFHAMGVFRETGSLRVLAELADKPMTDVMEKFSSFFLTGMPIEAGAQATRLLERLSPDGSSLPDMPLTGEIAGRISDQLKPLAGPAVDADAKKGLPLNQEELQRQAAYIDRYLQTGQLNLAFGLMREWVVSLVILARDNGRSWLKHKDGRQPVEHFLGGLAALLQDKHNPARDGMTDEQKQWGQLWNDICETRNSLQHHGMKQETFKPNNKVIKRLKQTWLELKTWSLPPEFGGGHDRLLICPIGKTPGVLYSALKHVQPERCLVICSEDSRKYVQQSLKEAEWSGEELLLPMSDPFTGVEEFGELERNAAHWLYQADEVHANITGGTSLMSALVGKLSESASRKYQRPIRRFVLIDKRTPDEQRGDPWQLGDIYYLDGEPVENRQCDHTSEEAN